MRTFLLLVVLGMAALLTQAEQCFDHARIDAEYKPLKAECKASIHDEDAVTRMKKLTKCLITKKGWLHEDGTFDFTAFEEESKKILTTDRKDEIMSLMKTCWESSGDGETKLAEFFGCYKPKVNAICTDALTWDD